MPGTRRTRSPTTITWLSNGADPCSTTTPSSTVAEIVHDGESSTAAAMASWTATSRSSSERRKTVSRSLRVTMPINRPSSSTTGSRPRCRWWNTRAAWPSVCDESMVTTGEVIISPVVTIDSSQTLGQAARVFHQRHLGRLPVVEDDGRLIGIVTRSDLLTVFLRSDEDLLVAVQEAIAAAVDDSPSCTISATVDDGVVVLQGSAPLLSQVMVVGDRVRRVPGIVHLDVKATAVYDDVHPAMVGP